MMEDDLFTGTESAMAKITDKALGMLFSDDLRRILGMGIYSEEQRTWALGLPVIHKLFVERNVINDDYIDRNEEVIKLVITSTLGVKGVAREQLKDMLQTQTRILTMNEVQENRGVIR